jgi:hypothetical protein
MSKDDRDMTILEWCARHNWPRTKFYTLPPKHRPKILEVPGTRAPRITAESNREWEQRMYQLRESEAVKREAERRSKQTSMAGKVAAKSPLHVTNKRQRAKV